MKTTRVRSFCLTSASLVPVKTINGKQTRWTNLRLVRRLTGRKPAFRNYVRKEAGAFLS